MLKVSLQNFKTVKRINRYVAASLLAILLSTVSPSPVQAAGTVSSAIDAQNGFPLWYEDARGIRVVPCIDGVDPQCVLPAAGEEPNFDPSKPTEFPVNFASEHFNYIAESDIITTPKGGKFFMRFAVEGAFLNEDPVAGDQMVFSRIRATGTNLEPNSTYTVTHPYGVDTYNTDSLGLIRRGDGTEDIGCGASPCDFSLALGSRVLNGFLKWETGAPAGYIGDAVTPHTVVGSPTGNNFVRIEGPGLPDGGLETNLFTVSGKLASNDAPPPPPPGCTADTAPAQPTLTAPANGSTNLETSPTLTWNTLADFGTNCAGNNNQFELFMDQGDVDPVTSQGIIPSTQTSLIVTGLTPNTTYSWKVRATNGVLTTDSAVQTFTTAAPVVVTPPSSPSKLKAVSAGGNIFLSWIDNSTNEENFVLERRLGATGAFIQVATISADTTSFTDVAAPKGLLTYRLKACNSAGCSDFSNNSLVFKLAPVVANPTNLKARISVGDVNLTWKDNASTETRFEVERKAPVSSSFVKIGTIAANTTSFTDTTAVKGINLYRVRACNANSCSGYSNIGVVIKP